MHRIIKNESAIELLGIPARAMNVVARDADGRILNQKIIASKSYREDGKNYRITATLRFDDECKNGHETFSITGDIIQGKHFEAGGCIHDDISHHFPQLVPLIKWHLVSTDGPMHYIANTIYHVQQGRLDYARDTAVWPEATDAELLATNLKDALIARLPALLEKFKADMLAAGFLWPSDQKQQAA